MQAKEFPTEEFSHRMGAIAVVAIVCYTVIVFALVDFMLHFCIALPALSNRIACPSAQLTLVH